MKDEGGVKAGLAENTIQRWSRKLVQIRSNYFNGKEDYSCWKLSSNILILIDNLNQTHGLNAESFRGGIRIAR